MSERTPLRRPYEIRGVEAGAPGAAQPAVHGPATLADSVGLGDCPSPTCDKMRRFVSAENPCRPGRPRDGDFSGAARNSSQVLAHSRVTLLFFRPRLGEMLQDAGQPQHGGCAGRVLRLGPRMEIGTTRF